MTTKFATYGGGIGEGLNECDKHSFKISPDDSRRVRLHSGQYASDFLTNIGDEFHEDDGLLYIKTENGEIISCDNYAWDNTLIPPCYYIFENLFGNSVKATKINSHYQIHLINVA